MLVLSLVINSFRVLLSKYQSIWSITNKVIAILALVSQIKGQGNIYFGLLRGPSQVLFCPSLKTIYPLITKI